MRPTISTFSRYLNFAAQVVPNVNSNTCVLDCVCVLRFRILSIQKVVLCISTWCMVSQSNPWSGIFSIPGLFEIELYSMCRSKKTRSHNCTLLSYSTSKNLVFVGNDPGVFIVSNEKELIEISIIIFNRPFFSPILIRPSYKCSP